jgi:putative DNA primase/helicase
VNTEAFLDRLENVRPTGSGWSARCPAHEDRRSSLSVSEDNEAIGVKCHAGCTTLAIVRELGIEMEDLFFGSREKGKASEPPNENEIETVYTYEDASGKPVFEVVRFRGKRFSQRIYGSNEWGLKGLENKPLFHLPQLLAADPSRRVYLVEGEKDVLAIERAGGVATTAVGGGGPGKWNHNYAHALRGRHVRIVADKDEPGIAHALAAFESLDGQAASVEIVQARTGKDASDHLAAGHTLDEFMDMPVGLDGLELTRFSSIEPEEIEWVPGWEGFVPYSGLTSLVGMPGVNKSTLTCRVVADVTRRGDPAMIIASEDAIASVVRPRLEAAGADIDLVHLVRVRGGRHITFPQYADALRKNVEREGVKVVVVDPIEAHLDTSVVANAHANATIRTALAPLAEVADAAKAAVIMVGHPNKNRSSDPMMRAGGSIGIPGAARSALMMGNHPDHPSELGIRVLASYKGNWAERPQSLVFHVELAPVGKIGAVSIRLQSRGETPIQAYELLKRGTNDAE